MACARTCRPRLHASLARGQPPLPPSQAPRGPAAVPSQDQQQPPGPPAHSRRTAAQIAAAAWARRGAGHGLRACTQPRSRIHPRPPPPTHAHTHPPAQHTQVPHPERWILHVSQACILANVKEGKRVSLMLKHSSDDEEEGEGAKDSPQFALCTLVAGRQVRVCAPRLLLRCAWWCMAQRGSLQPFPAQPEFAQLP